MVETFLLVVSLGIGLANLGCLLYIIYKLYVDKGFFHALIGFFCCQLYPFIWGWLNAGRLQITDVMMFWTFTSLLSLVLQLSTTALDPELFNQLQQLK